MGVIQSHTTKIKTYYKASTKSINLGNE